MGCFFSIFYNRPLLDTPPSPDIEIINLIKECQKPDKRRNARRRLNFGDSSMNFDLMTPVKLGGESNDPGISGLYYISDHDEIVNSQTSDTMSIVSSTASSDILNKGMCLDDDDVQSSPKLMELGIESCDDVETLAVMIDGIDWDNDISMCTSPPNKSKPKHLFENITDDDDHDVIPPSGMERPAILANDTLNVSESSMGDLSISLFSCVEEDGGVMTINETQFIVETINDVTYIIISSDEEDENEPPKKKLKQ